MSGRIEVKGFCYEDIMAILLKNGYDVQITAKANSNPSEGYYTIDYVEHKEVLPWD